MDVKEEGHFGVLFAVPSMFKVTPLCTDMPCCVLPCHLRYWKSLLDRGDGSPKFGRDGGRGDGSPKSGQNSGPDKGRGT